ncbi:hypothetical protein SAMN04488122_0350 [Chitinophaga arvensicola]|uniref:Uncharacterized protein n=1 Tax=Chitinophaga arvensicola TaxID=29529 RepID=A0A1I0NSR8_9BACT|nr:hypothetical protein SAMN04488122_0350 [Chitinophaga arvensicola]
MFSCRWLSRVQARRQALSRETDRSKSIFTPRRGLVKSTFAALNKQCLSVSSPPHRQVNSTFTAGNDQVRSVFLLYYNLSLSPLRFILYHCSPLCLIFICHI